MTNPRQPTDHPPPETKTETDPHGHAPGGVPPEADDEEPKGTPHSDRAKTENAGRS